MRLCRTVSSSRYFCFSEVSIFETGMPVHEETTLAMSSSLTSCRSRDARSGESSCSLELSAFWAACSSLSRFGIIEYFNSAAFSRFPSRVNFSMLNRSFSSCSLRLLILSIAPFSFCHWSFMALRFAVISASSFSSFASRSFEV